MDNTIKGYKGFNPDFKCRDFQYETGKTYEQDEDVKVCNNGFHFCEEPLSVFNYYPPIDDNGKINKFASVEGGGRIDKDSDNTKVACSTIRIGAELNFMGLAKAQIEHVKSGCDKSKGQNRRKEKSIATAEEDSSVASNSGDSSVASNSGDGSVASNSGDSSVASNSGYHSVASNSGYRSVASNSGDSSVASNSGDSSVASNSGYRSVASNSGYRSVASNSGYRSVASNSGYRSVASNSGDSSVASNSGDSSVASNSGDSSVASNSGDSSVASNSGYSSVASNSGDSSVASNSGYSGISVAWGIESSAKGTLGSYIVLSDWQYNGYKCILKDAQMVKVDGEIIKADTLYKISDGKIIEA